MNKKVYIFDNVFDGHHTIYMKALEEIEIVKNISKFYKLESNKKKITKYIRERRALLKYVLKKIEENSILHLLYLDQLYVLGPMFINKKNKKIIGTLHHYPQNKIKEVLLRIVSKKIDTIIVHSDYLKDQLLKLGISNVNVIDYPIFNEYRVDNIEEVKQELGLDQNKYIISALGGTRYDKGLDILIEAFKYIDNNIKDKIQLNICGKEESIKSDYIIKRCDELSIIHRVKLDYMTDEEFYKNIKVSDSIVIPYRKIFTGNSGPMTEGIYQNKPIIAPNSGNLGYLMNRYKLGVTFESENSKDLALAIQKLINEGWEYSSKSIEYRERLRPEYFIKKHEKLYMNALKMQN